MIQAILLSVAEETLGTKLANEIFGFEEDPSEIDSKIFKKKIKNKQITKPNIHAINIEIKLIGNTKTKRNSQRMRKRKKKKSRENNDSVFSQEDSSFSLEDIYEKKSLSLKYLNDTITILLNCCSQGLMHSFVRHYDQWINFIPELNNFLNRLPADVFVVLKEIQQVSSELKKEDRRKKLKKLYDLLEYIIDRGTSPFGKRFNVHFLILNLNFAVPGTRIMLSIIQMKLFDFICRNVQNEYVGDFVNEERITNLFRVKDLSGKPYVMEIVISHQLDPEDNFWNERPFVSIITVFFMTGKKLKKLPNFVPKP